MPVIWTLPWIYNFFFKLKKQNAASTINSIENQDCENFYLDDVIVHSTKINIMPKSILRKSSTMNDLDFLQEKRSERKSEITKIKIWRKQ